jgi:hypothetical protein
MTERGFLRNVYNRRIEQRWAARLSNGQPMRFGPDPHWQKIADQNQAQELERIVRETMDRVNHGLWHWALQEIDQ